MRKAEAFRNASRDGDGPVDAGRHDRLDALGHSEPLDRGLVLGGDESAPIRVAKAGRGSVAIDRDDEEAASPRRLEQAELRRSGA